MTGGGEKVMGGVGGVSGRAGGLLDAAGTGGAGIGIAWTVRDCV